MVTIPNSSPVCGIYSISWSTMSGLSGRKNTWSGKDLKCKYMGIPRGPLPAKMRRGMMEGG